MAIQASSGDGGHSLLLCSRAGGSLLVKEVYAPYWAVSYKEAGSSVYAGRRTLLRSSWNPLDDTLSQLAVTSYSSS